MICTKLQSLTLLDELERQLPLLAATEVTDGPVISCDLDLVA